MRLQRELHLQGKFSLIFYKIRDEKTQVRFLHICNMTLENMYFMTGQRDLQSHNDWLTELNENFLGYQM